MSKQLQPPSFLLNEDFSNITSHAPPCLIRVDSAVGVFTSGDVFFDELVRYDNVDVITYTCNGAVHPDIKLRRLIVGVNEPLGHTTFKNFHPSMGYKRYCNIHAKLYIGWVRSKPCAYVGSHNFSTPRNEEIMVRCSQPQTAVLIKYFDALWKDKNSPIKQIK